MAALSTDRIVALLEPFLQRISASPEPFVAQSAAAPQPASLQGPDSALQPVITSESQLPPELLGQLSAYLDLLLRWNRRVSLTAIHSAEEIVQRHFGESLFTGLNLAVRLPVHAELLDYGSGAGFPGLPIQLLLPHLHVTLAESQVRKAAFLREAVRTLGLPTEIWARRVEEMPSERRFDAVALRAVDRMEISCRQAEARVQPGGWLAILAGEKATLAVDAEEFGLPGSERRRLILRQKH